MATKEDLDFLVKTGQIKDIPTTKTETTKDEG